MQRLCLDQPPVANHSLAHLDGDKPVGSIHMYAIQEAAQQANNARAALMLIMIIVVIFWRTVLRVVLAVITVAVAVAVGTGAAVLLHGIHP